MTLWPGCEIVRQMRILVAPDKFKGSLTASEAARHIAAGLRQALPKAEIVLLPIADGGEGTAEVICAATGGQWLSCTVHDANGTSVEARYAMIDDGRTAVMEMSQAAGLWRIPPERRDPCRASSFGVGEMLLAATERGASKIILGLGGSATNDGGFGLARALGFRFLGKNGSELAGPVTDLLQLARIEAPVGLSLPPVVAAFDVRIPLLGERGATRLFGTQKGASPAQLDLLEQALARLAEVASCDLHTSAYDLPGAGAAGGLGFGLATFCGASLRSGFEVVAETIDLRKAVAAADVVVTGEGRLDRQTCEGKAPAGIAALARELGKPVFAIVGRSTPDGRALFDRVLDLATPPVSTEEAIVHAAASLRIRAAELAASF